MEVEVIDQQTQDAPAQDSRVLGGAAATVPGPNRDAEAALINQQMWQAVHGLLPLLLFINMAIAIARLLRQNPITGDHLISNRAAG